MVGGLLLKIFTRAILESLNRWKLLDSTRLNFFERADEPHLQHLSSWLKNPTSSFPMHWLIHSSVIYLVNPRAWESLQPARTICNWSLLENYMAQENLSQSVSHILPWFTNLLVDSQTTLRITYKNRKNGIRSEVAEQAYTNIECIALKHISIHQYRMCSCNWLVYL